MTNTIPFTSDEEKIIRKLVTDYVRKERMRLVREQTRVFEDKSTAEFEDKRSIARNGKSLTETKNALESHMRTLTGLLKIRNQVQMDIDSVENASRRVGFLRKTREEEKSRSVHEFNKTQLDRFREAVDRTHRDETNASIDQINRIITLEKAKSIADSLSKKYHPRVTAKPSVQTSAPSMSNPSTAASSRTSLNTSLDRRKPKSRTVQLTTKPPKPTNPLPTNFMDNNPDEEFKYIDIPDRFLILSPEKENIQEFVNRIGTGDVAPEQLSDVRRSIQDIKQTIFSERRDPSRAIERRRAALAALRLRYGNK